MLKGREESGVRDRAPTRRTSRSLLRSRPLQRLALFSAVVCTCHAHTHTCTHTGTHAHGLSSPGLHPSRDGPAPSHPRPPASPPSLQCVLSGFHSTPSPVFGAGDTTADRTHEDPAWKELMFLGGRQTLIK